MSEDQDLDLVEQLADEFAARLRAGERPSIKEFTDRHPELAEVIRDTFEAVAMMENMAPGSDDSFGAADDESATVTLPELKQSQHIPSRVTAHDHRERLYLVVADADLSGANSSPSGLLHPKSRATG